MYINETIQNTVNTSIHLRNKNQQDAQFYSKFISIINLYMFPAGLLLIIRRYFSVSRQQPVNINALHMPIAVYTEKYLLMMSSKAARNI